MPINDTLRKFATTVWCCLLGIIGLFTSFVIAMVILETYATVTGLWLLVSLAGVVAVCGVAALGVSLVITSIRIWRQ